jgi:hypothetical protein
MALNDCRGAIQYPPYESQKGCGGVLTALYSLYWSCPACLGHEWKENHHHVIFNQKAAEFKFVSHDTFMTAKELFNILCMSPKKDVVVC